MPLSFTLPTTSFLTLQDYLTSSTHPSLPVHATSQRSVARQQLKEHKRLPDASKAVHLNDVVASLTSYVPYLLALDAGLSGKNVGGDEIQVDLAKEVQVEWRPTLTNSVGGREPARVKLQSFEYEMLFSLSTLATTHYLVARNHLHSLYYTVTPTPEQKTSEVSAAVKQFTQAGAIFNSLVARANQLVDDPPVPDVAWSTFEALASISRAEANLAAVLKDDPYPSAIVQSRNRNDQDWMIKAPDIPKVRAHLFARFCIAAAEHASKATSTLGRSGGITRALTKYADDLRRTARGKACRFLAIDAELSSKTGEAIAWLGAAKKELGFVQASSGGSDDAKTNMFSKLKKEWTEKREDRKIEKGGDWGSDGGKFEEGKVVDMLLAKWTSMNNTVNVQQVPPFEPLLSKLPSGREYDVPKPWAPPGLDENTLAQLRALPDLEAVPHDRDEEDSDDEEADAPRPVGAFPEESSKDSSYY